MSTIDEHDLTIPGPDLQTTPGRLYAPADGTAGPRCRLVLAHGAGAGQHHVFMTRAARALAGRGVEVVTFDFPYMAQRRRLPDRMPLLHACFRAVLGAADQWSGAGDARLFIGGKSMGGRVATHVAADDPALAIAGLVLLGYPLHPPGRPQQLRDAHLAQIGRPMLIVQGSRDAFGTPDELTPVLARLTPSPRLHVVDGGDHSFVLPARRRADQHATSEQIYDVVVRWMGEIAGR